MGYNNGYDEGCLQLQTSFSFSGVLPVVFTISLVRRGGISNSFGRVAEGPVNDYEPILMS